VIEYQPKAQCPKTKENTGDWRLVIRKNVPIRTLRVLPTTNHQSLITVFILNSQLSTFNLFWPAAGYFEDQVRLRTQQMMCSSESN